MKKVFFQLGAMNVGGVEKSWLSLVDALPQDRYEIHLGLLSPKGGYMKSIPDNVFVHVIDCYDSLRNEINDPPLWVLKDKIRKRQYVKAFILFLLYLISKFTNSRYWFYKYILRDVPQMKDSYDVAVAYAGPSQMVDFFVCEKINALQKYGWIHFDVAKFGIDRGMTAQLYKKYRKIFIVSETGKDIFDRLFPQFSHKTVVFHNVVSRNKVIQLAEDGPTFEDKYDGKRILTVGRISEEKGQRTAIESLKLLLEKNFQVKWYFVGDGKDKCICEHIVRKLGLVNNVIFLGTQINPYGFMKDCDIYMQPSRHEGFCITLAEALCFGHPIVATDFTGAQEQLKDRKNGLVTGMTADKIASGLEKVLLSGCQECLIDIYKPQPNDIISSIFD